MRVTQEWLDSLWRNRRGYDEEIQALIRLSREALEVRDAMAAMYGKNLQWVKRLDRAAGEEESRG